MRGYASIASKAPSRLRGKNLLSLDHFIQKQRVLALWRDILRATASIPDANSRKDMRQWARTGFERHRNVTDLEEIRYLYSSGKTEVDAMKNTLINSGVLTK
ncbi:hypothetical protein BS50DRAFT_636303 [Corynespora cassiicola Philippines]|uniref:LYR motif-containing protein 2 n=1 Tax=Corynespora cassiicola Philippines TaxID=1448308 RepID=A0A2T2NJG6_CORCC|nr:hypothetical protein BS50DRAFT_636303 [Corynespora cassiicola Philippines]